MPVAKIRIVIVDDHPAVRLGLESIFNDYEDLQVVGLAEDGAQGLRVCEQQKPDVVLMDIAVPQIDGVEATRRVKAVSPSSQVIILTSATEERTISNALEAGAIGYLVKTASVREMVSAIRAAYSGKRSLSPEALEGLIRFKTSRDPLEEPLSDREREVLALIVRGFTNPQIAEELSLSLSTIKFHIGSLYKKLNVSNRAEATTRAFELKLLDGNK